MSNESGVPLAYWQALMRFAQQVGAHDDDVNGDVTEDVEHAGLRQLSSGNREWLQKAMSDLVSETDPIVQMKQKLQILTEVDFQTAKDDQVDKAVDAISYIADLCDDIDVANDFYKVGGYRVLVPMLASPNAVYREEAANLIGVLSQNNPKSQDTLYSVGIMPVLLELLDSDSEAAVKIKAMFAISSLVRGNPQLESYLVDVFGGIGYLQRATMSGIGKLQVKATFLLGQIAQKNKDTILKMGLLDQLITFTQSENGVLREIALTALNNLCIELVYTDEPEMFPHSFSSLRLGVENVKDTIPRDLKNELSICSSIIESLEKLASERDNNINDTVDTDADD